MAFGLPIGLILGHRSRARAALLPVVNFFRNLSPLAWIPFAILWFGIGDVPQSFLIFMASFFPVVIATIAAVASIPSVYFRVARDYHFGSIEMLPHVTLPAIAPQVITALRVTAGLAWVVVVAAEMIAGRDGLGFAIWDARNGLRMDLLVVGMIAIATFMIAPLAMNLREQGVPVEICYLGHRDGSTVRAGKRDLYRLLRTRVGCSSRAPRSASLGLALPRPPTGWFNYDFKTDLVLAGAGGVRLFKQDQQRRYVDVTASAALPGSISSANYAGSWAADYEMDGDLDIVLAPVDGQPLVLRNNGDGTFKEVRPFEGVTQTRGFAWVDLDADGDPDATLLDAQSAIWFFINERGGQFRVRSSPQGLDPLSPSM